MNWLKHISLFASVVVLSSVQGCKPQNVTPHTSVFPAEKELPRYFLAAIQQQRQEGQQILGNRFDSVRQLSVDHVLRTIDSDSNYAHLFPAEFWIAEHYREAIPLLIERVIFNKNVGLTNTGDLIIWERAEAGHMDFHGQRDISKDDLFTIAGRANHLLITISGENFGRVSMHSTTEGLHNLQKAWREWFRHLLEMSASPFKINYHTFGVDTSIASVVYTDNTIWILDNARKLYTINHKGEIISAPPGEYPGFDELITNQDSILGISPCAKYLFRNSQWQKIAKCPCIVPVYKDDRYVVTSSYNGEWGGSVFFKDRKNGKIYTCQATCVMDVLKHNGQYYVVTTLAHMAGSCSIILIKDPTMMDEHNPSRMKDRNLIYADENETRSMHGTKTLLQGIGNLLTGAFVYKNELYAIMRDDRRNMIVKVDSAGWKLMGIIDNDDHNPYNPYGVVVATQPNAYPQSAKGMIYSKGFVVIEGNVINVYDPVRW